MFRGGLMSVQYTFNVTPRPKVTSPETVRWSSSSMSGMLAKRDRNSCTWQHRNTSHWYNQLPPNFEKVATQTDENRRLKKILRQNVIYKKSYRADKNLGQNMISWLKKNTIKMHARIISIFHLYNFHTVSE